MSQQINLFNPVFLRQKKYFSAVAAAQAFGLLVIGMLVLYAYAVFQMEGLTRQVADMDRQHQLAQEGLARATAEFGAKQVDVGLAAEVKALQAGVQARQDLLTVLNAGGFGAENGLAEYMRALARSVVGGLWLTGFSIDEGATNFVINGLSLSSGLVPAFVRGLGAEKVMRGRALDNLSIAGQAFPVTIRGVAQPAQVPVLAFVLSAGKGNIGVLDPAEQADSAQAPPPGAAAVNAGAAKAAN